uniref:Rab-GAP TBC domain-containing protein n=1 Tax=Ditylenchus dipsaci TaxID=166011 RepID=A0A915E0A3_9BILA
MMPLNSNIAGSGEAAICTPNSPTTTAEEVNAATVSNNQDEACSSTLTTPAFVVDCSGVDGGDWLMRMAADSKKRSDDIWANIELGQNKEYIEWLQRWDSFLVNHVLQPLPSPNTQMKTLVRFGIPHAYRGRVWKSIVNFLTNNIQAETGKGYYACLLKKAEKIQDTSNLIRTLPTNKMFEKEDSQKAQMLKNVLYAFRFHNKEVEYCQGLNRLAAIGLLYLQEADAFWFLVSCVEYLQPPDYYTPSLVGAVVDQKVLLDLVQEKIPNLWVHLRQVDVDLTLFTLSWFLTVFVDTLSHKIYINIFDVFLCEGNKVLFRFALALLKSVNQKFWMVDYKSLADIAFNQMNPFPAKAIEIKRANYMAHFKSVPRSK